MQNKIDFVVTWVDGNDPEWIKEKKRYLGIEDSEDNVGESRYRDWGLMRYWFRGVEKYAPWVHKVYFVTCGQRPEWLNVECDKLVCINHADYMPKDTLPTFNSNAIEIGIHKINGLSDQFVVFNDDFFPVASMKPDDFFVDNLPCDYACLDALTPSGDFEYLRMNNTKIINNYFSFKDVIRNNKSKWFSFKDLKSLNRTLRLLNPWTKFPGIRDYHGPIAFTKHDFDVVWERIPKILEDTRKHRVRSKEDHTMWLFRYWRLVEGRFFVKSQQEFGYTQINQDEDVDNICATIMHTHKKVLCINDEYKGDRFLSIREKIIKSFEYKFPDKSSFEL